MTTRKTASRTDRAPRASASRSPRTAARATAPDTEYDTPADEPEVSAAEAQETEADGHYVTGQLRGEDVRIIPPGAWKQSWRRLLMAGQIDDFADIVLHPDDYELYEELDPTNDEFGDLVGTAAERAGESLGKSSGPAASSRRTRRR